MSLDFGLGLNLRVTSSHTGLHSGCGAYFKKKVTQLYLKHGIVGIWRASVLVNIERFGERGTPRKGTEAIHSFPTSGPLHLFLPAISEL